MADNGKKVEVKNKKLFIPDDVVIPFIRGDGTGPDIWGAAVTVFDAACKKAYKGKKKINWLEVLAGEKAADTSVECTPLFGEALEAYRKRDWEKACLGFEKQSNLKEIARVHLDMYLWLANR